jgi:hypothetical protein
MDLNQYQQTREEARRARREYYSGMKTHGHHKRLLKMHTGVPQPVILIAALMALAAAILFLISSKYLGIVEYNSSSQNTLLITAHVLRALGEGTLLTTLALGCGIVVRRTQWLMFAAIIMLVVTHLLSAYLLYHPVVPVSFEAVYYASVFLTTLLCCCMGGDICFYYNKEFLLTGILIIAEVLTEALKLIDMSVSAELLLWLFNKIIEIWLVIEIYRHVRK